jgi:hypothetical protein
MNIREMIDDLNKLLPPHLQLEDGCGAPMLWAALFRLHGDYIEGPKGHATWKDAALSSLLALNDLKRNQKGKKK